jgi:hypothetical protein
MLSFRHGHRRSFARSIVCGPAVLSLLSGCVSTINTAPTDRTAVDPGVGFTVLFSRALAPRTTPGLGKDAVECVTSAIVGTLPKARLVAPEQFQRSVFPDLPLESLPLSRESLAILGRDETFRGRVAAAGLRYLVAVGGDTDQSSPRGAGVCGSGPRGGGCAGFWWWERDSTLWAEILDVSAGESVAKVEARVSGRPWFLVLGVLPLGAPAFTETWACHKLGRGVVEFLKAQGVASP